MSEKFSEQHLREQKVAALKNRLLGEISLELQQELFDLRSLTEREASMNPRFVRDCIYKMHNLYALEDYLKEDGLFMSFVMADGQRDVIIYKVHEDTLDWMAQNKHLLSDIMYNIAKFGVPAEVVLEDEFFERQVFTVMEKALWSEREKVTKGETVDALIGDATDRCGAANAVGDNKHKNECFIEH